MGVHDKEKYPEIKRLLGIPDGEPIFILRAQDDLSGHNILDYHVRYLRRCRARQVKPDPDFVSDLEEILRDFDSWQSSNTSKVKFPD